MTAVSYPVGTPRSAANRGGDCRARDLTQLRNVHGHHRFAATTDCRINNGLIRLTVGAAGAAPSLTIEGRRGAVTVGDTYSDTYVDLYGGTLSTPAWIAMGTLTIDSPAVSALLTGVRIVRVSAEAVTIRLVAPLMNDAYVTLRRFYRSVLIQHGATRGSLVTTTRRIRITGPPTITGTASAGRVEEVSPTVDGFPRFVAALDDGATANAGAFSMTSPAVVSARFGAGIATYALRDQPVDHHRQLADDSRSLIVMETA